MTKIGNFFSVFSIALFFALPVKGQQIGAFARSTDRIVDGHPVDAGDAPWSASIQFNGNHRCGGTLISPIWSRNNDSIIGWSSDDTMPEWVITAAHCLVDNNGNFLSSQDIKVFTGSHQIDSDEGEYQSVLDFHLHPNYDDFLIQNDIAVIHLSQPSKPFLPRDRASIRLPLIQESVWLNRPGVQQVVAGWGHTEQGGVISPDLLEVTIPRADTAQCAEIYAKLGHDVPFGTFCAGYLAGSEDSCQGDSGGAIFYRPPKNPGRFSWTSNPIYLGSVTWGIGCGSTETHGLYTSVFPYIDWITGYLEGKNNATLRAKNKKSIGLC